MSNEVWEELYERLVTLINTHETTLIFVNTRRCRAAGSGTQRAAGGCQCLFPPWQHE